MSFLMVLLQGSFNQNDYKKQITIDCINLFFSIQGRVPRVFCLYVNDVMQTETWSFNIENLLEMLRRTLRGAIKKGVRDRSGNFILE